MAVRIIPYSVYDVSAVEDWLEKMSRKGMHFKKFTGAPWAEFWEGEPRDYRYRLEPCRRKEAEPDGETVTVYHQAGWDYVTTRKDKTFHVWRSQKNIEPQELHTDPVVQSYGYEWLEKKLHRSTVITLLAVITAVLCILWVCAHANVHAAIHPSSDLVPQLIIAASMYIFFVYQAVSDVRVMQRLLKSLRAGVPLGRGHWPFPGRKLAWYGYFTAFSMYLLLIWAEPATQGINWDGDPADYPVPIPFVSVELLGREEQTSGWVAWNSSYLMEAVTMVEGNEGEYTALWGWIGRDLSNRTKVYRLRLGFLAEPLLKEMVENVRKTGVPVLEELKDDRFDDGWYAFDGETQILMLRKKTHVLYYSVRVPTDLRDHLELFAEAMNTEVRLPESPECGEYHGWWR